MMERRDLPVDRLLLDIENPRLDQVAADQDDALRRLLAAQRDKILALVEHISKHGLNPADLLIVAPAVATRDCFIVLEGNRRLVALRLLQRPEDAGDGLTSSQMKRLREQAGRAKERSVTIVPTVVVQDRDEAAAWLETRHTGELGGAGLVPWGAQERQRFIERLGGSKTPAMQLLDLVQKAPGVDERVRRDVPNVPLTNFQRLMNDPDVRAKVGVERQGNQVRLLYPVEEVLKPLARIVRDLAEEDIMVSDIDTKDLRREYLAGFGASDLPNPRRAFSVPQDLPASPAGTAEGPRPAGRRAEAPRGPRRTLVPRGRSLAVTGPRLSAIFRELCRLPVDDYPNAVAVLFRVFLEMSADHYVLQNRLMTEPQWEKATLAQKLQAVHDALRKKRFTAKQLAPVRRTIGDRRLLAGGIDTFHNYVHNLNFSPPPGDLKTAWDDLEPSFFAPIWTPGEKA